MSRTVLQLLRAEGRLSAPEIAERLGITPAEAAAEVKRLHDEKVILGYRAIINPEKTGEDSVLAIIEVKVTPQREVGFDAIARRIYKFPEVRTCYLMSGTYDLLLLVEGESLRQVASFVAEKLATLEHVSSTTTHFLLRKYKEDGLVIHEEDETERLAVSA
ncbi:MAG: Lrp/AsnC family transcriptional regulator [Candidatus Sumerlaeia bacterium]|nr:Lrp/AsnC family transcriptional regulator [Candidatus Sumerlaeia bacterium]